MVQVSSPLTLPISVVRKLRISAQTVALRRALRADRTFRPDTNQPVDVLLNFPDGVVNAYQVRQWYGPLEYLAKTHTVAILCYQPEAAKLIAGETSIKVVLTPSFTDLSEVERVLRPKVILYPNQNYANYRILGLTSAEHIFICHGESDKIYMASNWVKIFNYFFVAGQASKDRLSRHVRNYDVNSRTIEIGRPQIDFGNDAPIVIPPHKTTVLYAPTWEGGRRTMRYGSVASHGVEMVRALLSDDRFQIIYRPHPRTGIHLPEFESANNVIKRLINDENIADPHGQHVVDDSPFGWQINYADIMITDVSAVAYDWLTTAKPLLATKPSEPLAVMPAEGFMSDTPLIEANKSSDIVTIIGSLMSDAHAKERLSAWADYYYGDRSSGVSLKRFIQAIEHVINERDNSVATCVERPQKHPPQTQQLGFTNTGSFSDSQAPALFRYLSAATTKLVNAWAHKSDGTERPGIDNNAMVVRSADIVVSTMDGPRALDALVEWLPALERIHHSSSVAIVTGSRRTYNRLRSLTGLRVTLGLSASETEQLFADLSPKINLQFEQANLNLRETTHRKVHHVYVGSAKHDTWVNNRLRLFDTVIAPNKQLSSRIRSSLINFPPTISVLATQSDQVGDKHDVISNLVRTVAA